MRRPPAPRPAPVAWSRLRPGPSGATALPLAARLALAALAALSGCVGTLLVGEEPGADADPPEDARPDAETPLPPAFRDVICYPPVQTGVALPDDEEVFCNFRVVGRTGGDVTLSCRDPWGDPFPCDGGGPGLAELHPAGPAQLPVEHGWFYFDAFGLAGSDLTIQWIAAAGAQEATFPLTLHIVPGSGGNHPPHLEVDCGGDTDGHVSVLAGETIQCNLIVTDPDLYDFVHWFIPPGQPPPPAFDPSPGDGDGVGVFPWHWQTALEESGQQRVFTFIAIDQYSPPVDYDLIVDVL